MLLSIYLLYVIGGVLARQAHRLVIDNWFAHPLVLCYGLHTQLGKITKAEKEEDFNAGGTVAVEWSKEKRLKAEAIGKRDE